MRTTDPGDAARIELLLEGRVSYQGETVGIALFRFICGVLLTNPFRQIHRPPHAMSPPRIGRHSAGPLEPFGLAICYLTSTQ